MPKKQFVVNDFSGGVNGFLDPQNIAENELVACDGFKAEPGRIEILGNYLNLAYSSGLVDTTNNINIEPGYGLFTFSHDYTQAGTLEKTNYLAQLDDTFINVANIPGVIVTGTTYAAVDSNPDTITDSSNGFVTAGFKAGMVITVSGSSAGANNTSHIIDTVAAGTLTLSSASALTADAAGDTWTIRAFQYQVISLGTAASTAPFSWNGDEGRGVKPCFFIADGAFRVSPGNFLAKDNGSQTNGGIAANSTHGAFYDVTVDSDVTDDITAGDTIVISNQEVVALAVPDATSLLVARNMTGTFLGALADNATIYSVLDTRWRGVVQRKNFGKVTAHGTFTEWYSSFAHPRPPVDHHTDIDHDTVVPDYTYPFLVKYAVGDITIDGDQSPCIHVGYLNTTASDSGLWNGASITLYTTALYDEAKQESQPNKGDTFTVAAAKELGVWIGVEYSDAAESYRINKRVTGARVYYEDSTNDPGILFQLLEIDFEKGCKKAGAEVYTDWTANDANETCECPYDDGSGSTASNRTTGDAFIFEAPPKVITYEINTGYQAHVNTHARYKTATICNRRLFVGNIYQSGVAYGDRMISSPPNKFDILPETNFIDVAVGDGDEIVKLESYADRVLQFKKRSLYIINAGGSFGQEYLESEHKDMGVENPSQTCMTEFGVAWVNARGVFLYDGQKINDLIMGKLELVNTTNRYKALNVTESNIPAVGYIQSKKWLVIHTQTLINDNYDTEGWIFDFKTRSWAFNTNLTITNLYKSNVVSTPDNECVVSNGVNSSSVVSFLKYEVNSSATIAAGRLLLLTKNYDLNAPGIKKKLRSIYVTYSCDENTKIEADIIYTHATGTTTDDLEEAGSGSTYYTEALGFKDTNNAIRTVELVPTTYVTNAYSFQLKLHNPDDAYPTGGDFQLYNIQFVFRDLGVR